MIVLDADAVHAALPWPRLVEELREAHRGPVPQSDVVVQSDPAGSGNQFVTLPGWLPGGLIAVKMVGVFPGNLTATPPEPSVQGLVGARRRISPSCNCSIATWTIQLSPGAAEMVMALPAMRAPL